jgi:hypothetical protein
MVARLACEKEPFDAMEKAITEIYQGKDDLKQYEKCISYMNMPLKADHP